MLVLELERSPSPSPGPSPSPSQAMGERADKGQESHGLLDDESTAQERPSCEIHVEANDEDGETFGPSRHPPKRPLFLASLVLGFVFILPLIGYTWPQGAYRPILQQLAIPLYPEKHALREAKTLEFYWNVTIGSLSPDGVEKLVYLVNVEARSGDRIIVHVHNGLDLEGVAIHWHGLRMKGFNAMDGAAGFTQCPIGPGQDFTYDFRIGNDEHGTFWWHAHSQVQRGDGLYGGFVVHQPGVVAGGEQDRRRDEALLLVGDWFHRTQTQVLNWYSDHGSMGDEPVPDSLLVNGRGRYNCSMAVPARPVICRQLASSHVWPLLRHRPRGAIRLRVVNSGSVAGVTMTAHAATLQPLSIDGGFHVRGGGGSSRSSSRSSSSSSSSSKSVGILYPGERVDLLLTMQRAATESSRLVIQLDDDNFGSLANPALNPNHTFQILGHSPQAVPDDGVSPATGGNYDHCDLGKIVAASPAAALPPRAQETLVLYLKTQTLSRFQNKPLGFVNNTCWKPQIPPLLAMDRTLWNDDQFVSWVGFRPSPEQPATELDIVVNNLDDGSHPVHLHGHSFYVLSSFRAEHRSGWGSYNPYQDEPLTPLNLADPVKKDTVSAPRRGHVVIRVRLDNPGLWMMHCHMLVHMATGMVTGLQVGQPGMGEHVLVDKSAASLCP